MNIIRYFNAKSIFKAISEYEPLLAVISFDGKTTVVSQIDEAIEHYILLMKIYYKDTDINKFFSIVFYKSGTDYTFVYQ